MVLKHNVLAMAIASVCLGVCATAYAGTAPSAGQQQDTQDQAQPSSTDKNSKDTASKHKTKKLEAVEVNGFISSIENSTALKRNASSIVEAVSAEQVGKLPGVSIADTLGRLPGLEGVGDGHIEAARIGDAGETERVGRGVAGRASPCRPSAVARRC